MLRLKHLPIDTGKENIVFIHRRCPEFQTEDANMAANRIEIHGGLQPLFASVCVCDDETLVKPDEIALTNQAFHLISMAEGSEVAISPAPPPASIDSVRRKINGGILSAKEYKSIIADLAAYRYTPIELAAFLVSNASFMSPQEVLSMTEALIEYRRRPTGGSIWLLTNTVSAVSRPTGRQ